MSKNILLLVTGMTPQIITETVWALACDPDNQNPWVPDEIKVVTTLDGIKEIEKTLLGREGIFQKMIREYGLSHIQFDKESLIAITDKDNQPLVDLKTPSDNEQAADKICNTIRMLTQNCNDTLHVSIAGGRKTMGFYAGYALSLYGRVQDALSHVLVSSEYEMLRGFFYPAKEPNKTNVKKFLKKIENNTEVLEEIKLDTHDAQVWLAKIPFVRMKDAVKDKHQLKSNDSFSQVVHKINESFNDVKLTINLHNQTIQVNEKFIISDMPPREFAMLHWFADLRKRGLDGVVAPTKKINSKDIQPLESKYIAALSEQFKPYYEEFKNTEEIQIDVDKQFFENVKSLLNTALQTNLGLELSEKITLAQTGRGQPFYLNIQPENIEIIDNFKK